MSIDYSARAKKAWETRHRNLQAQGSSAVQGKGDWVERGAGPGIRRAEADEMSHLVVTHDQHDTSFEREAKAKVAAKIKEAFRDMDVPASALDGLATIRSTIMFQKAYQGEYRGETLTVNINADSFYDKGGWQDFGEGSPVQTIGKTVAHEMGHHVHLSKLSDIAANEWARLSDNGRTCKISAYGRTNTTEHFAETFAAYAHSTFTRQDERGGLRNSQFTRGTLKMLEPEVYAFMERLWSDRSMWRQDGEVEYRRRRITGSGS